jgi:DNA-binding response OmpR family regulator
MASILVIDDSCMARAMVAELLTECGHEVDTFCPETLMDLYPRLRSSRPDLVILDMQFNDYEFDGLDIMGRIRERWDQLPVILLTASRDPELLAEFHGQRVNAILHKPEALRTLHWAVEGVLSKRDK